MRGLTWRPATRRRPTIDGLDLTVPAGQRVLLLGASGAGKSTVLLALAGLLDASAGELTGTWSPASRPGERGLLLQNPVHAIVGESIGRDAAFGPENAGLARAEIQDRVTAALRSARVDLDASHRCFAASGGQQQRIALAGALALEPGALLLDEPTSMLDEDTAQDVRAAVLAAVGPRTLVVAEHRVTPWLDHVDRIVLLGEQARVLVDGPVRDVLAHHRADLLAAGVRLPGPAGSASALLEESGPALVSPVVGTRPVAALRDVAVRRRRSADEPTRTTPVLAAGLELEARPGSLVAVTGPSGAGKTTLLRVLLGLDRPAAGRVETPAIDRIAWVPQNPEHSFVTSTVAAEVTASPRARVVSRGDALLAAAGLDHLAGAHPFAISGGEQRRLAIVAALAQSPALLVLDEPTVGLDAERWRDVVALVDRARADGCAVVVATHDPELVAHADHRLRLPVPAAPIARAGAVPPVDTTIRPVVRRPRALADRLNPLTALLVGVLGIVGSLAIDSWRTGVLAVALIALLAPLASRSVRGTLLRLLPVVLTVLTLAWSTALLSDEPALSAAAWLLGAKEGLRILAFVVPGLLVLGCLDPTALGDALGGLLRLPGRVVAASVGGLVRIGHLAQRWDLIVTARMLRGLGAVRSWRHPLRAVVSSVRLVSSCTFALLVDALRSASSQSVAMDARGFAQAHRRTWALPSTFGLPDVLGVAAGLALALWPWLARALWG